MVISKGVTLIASTEVFIQDVHKYSFMDKIQNIWTTFKAFFQKKGQDIQKTATTVSSLDYISEVNYVQEINNMCVIPNSMTINVKCLK